MTTLKAEFEQLKAQHKFDDETVLMNFFDKLPPVGVEEILSKWQGGDFDTKHWGTPALREQKWFGKWFRSQLDGSPLVCYNDEGKLYPNQLMNGECSLWMIEFRGKVSATMVYDGAPIFDHFRKVDDNTLMGVMNGKQPKGFPEIVANGKYYYFFLERIQEFPAEFVAL